ncbi:hypothetical protein FKW77_009115 [Venturia effusa]|uniref:Uncharacterized protein n=1 Tax=Venturia effusa TaxID=50376 RepID=A0A517L1X9_9PEZI|nr:hypothetical protein FKW77_009115 [Venturia effusa]
MGSQQDLQRVVKSSLEIDYVSIVTEMKGSALANSDWEILIASAPIALRCLGACFMAASSKDLRAIKVPKVPGATIDRPEDLATNLVRCSNLGTQAFLEASKRMTEILQLSKQSENKVYDIIDIMGNPKAAEKQLALSMRHLQQNATQCFEASLSIDKMFAKWLVFTSELWEACQARTGTIADEASKAVDDKAQAAAQVTDLQTQVAQSKQAMADIGKTMDTARVAYEKASNDQPKGWDIVGMQIVQGLADVVTTALSGAMSKKGSKSKTPTNGQTGQNGQNGTPSQTAIPDPGFAAVVKDLYCFDNMKPMLTKTDGDVDWAGIGTDGSGLKFIKGRLDAAKDALSKTSGTGLAKTTFSQALDDTISLATDILGTVKKVSEDLNAKHPAKGSEVVVRWQTKFESIFKIVHGLSVEAKSSAFNSSSPSGTLPVSQPQVGATDPKSSLGQAILAQAGARLETTARVLETTTKVYGENSKRLAEQQASLTAVNATLAKLTADVIQLSEAKEILLQCIALIIELKSRITDLTRFFGNLASVVSTVSESLCKKWLENIASAVTMDPAARARGQMKIGAYTLESAERTMVMQGAISIAGYFSFLADVADSWNSVSDKSIFPGIALAEQLSLPGDAKEKMAKLDAWSDAAAAHIKKICGEQRSAIVNQMDERLEAVRGKLKELPATAVPAAVADVAQKTLENKAASDVAALDAALESSPVNIVGRGRKGKTT